jgi:hypothetical protein
MAHFNIDLVAELMDDFLRMELAAQERISNSLRRQLWLARRNYNIVQSTNETLTTDNLLLRRILHEIFVEHPVFREAYRHIFEFEDLMTDNEDADDEMDPVQDVRRALLFDSDSNSDSDMTEVIDLTQNE